MKALDILNDFYEVSNHSDFIRIIESNNDIENKDLQVKRYVKTPNLHIPNYYFLCYSVKRHIKDLLDAKIIPDKDYKGPNHLIRTADKAIGKLRVSNLTDIVTSEGDLIVGKPVAIPIPGQLYFVDFLPVLLRKNKPLYDFVVSFIKHCNRIGMMAFNEWYFYEQPEVFFENPVILRKVDNIKLKFRRCVADINNAKPLEEFLPVLKNILPKNLVNEVKKATVLLIEAQKEKLICNSLYSEVSCSGFVFEIFAEPVIQSYEIEDVGTVYEGTVYRNGDKFSTGFSQLATPGFIKKFKDMELFFYLDETYRTNLHPATSAGNLSK